MADKKYWVPALERANQVVQLIAKEPQKWKLGEMSKRLGISKSTMFSLLQTLEALQWVTKNASDMYSLGLHYGVMGNAYFRQYDLVELFHKTAAPSMQKVQESIQLAKLVGAYVLYLAKINGSSQTQMVTGPGARIHAHATGLGKVLLSGLSENELIALYPEKKLERLTIHTIATKAKLLKELEQIRNSGYSLDLQEGVMGFCCVAAPIYNLDGQMVASVSISMPLHEWDKKKNLSIREVCDLASKLSFAN